MGLEGVPPFFCFLRFLCFSSFFSVCPLCRSRQLQVAEKMGNFTLDPVCTPHLKLPKQCPSFCNTGGHALRSAEIPNKKVALRMCVSGCRKRRSAKGVRSLFFVFGTLSIIFRSLFLTVLSLFSSLFAKLLLPNSFCQTPFAGLLLRQGDCRQLRVKIRAKLLVLRFLHHTKSAQHCRKFESQFLTIPVEVQIVL